RARTFLVSDGLKSRTRGPWALPPPMKIGARRAPWAAVAAAFLPAIFLAGAGDVAALAGGAGGAAAFLELPGDDAVEDGGARVDPEHRVAELDILAGLAAVEALDFDLHGLAFLAFAGGFRSGGRLGRRL